jgi:hypothetical protein
MQARGGIGLRPKGTTSLIPKALRSSIMAAVPPQIGHAADCGLHETFIAALVYNLRHTILPPPAVNGTIARFFKFDSVDGIQR